MEYVTQDAAGDWRIAGTRVSLASVIYQFHEGEGPEAILRDFPSLTLEQIHGALEFYLRNRRVVDESLQRRRVREEELQRECKVRNRDLRETIRSRSQERSDGT